MATVVVAATEVVVNAEINEFDIHIRKIKKNTSNIIIYQIIGEPVNDSGCSGGGSYGEGSFCFYVQIFIWLRFILLMAENYKENDKL